MTLFLRTQARYSRANHYYEMHADNACPIYFLLCKIFFKLWLRCHYAISDCLERIFSCDNFGGLERPRHLDYLHRRHHLASKISQIYGHDLGIGRGKLTRRERLPSWTKSEWRSEMRS